jgi:AAA15 family ATPase/GTPase
MIKGISIENFRVFHKTEINGFGLVNLFGGKNNAGKTCLLEALYAALKGSIFVSTNLRQQKLPLNDAQKNLFFNTNTTQSIIFDVKLQNDKTYQFYSNYNRRDIESEYFFNHSDLYKENVYNESLFWNNNRVSFILSKEEQYPDKLNLSAEFDRADINGESELILKAIQIIDPSVSELKTYATFPETLYLRKKNEKIALPITNYGDALQKMMRYILTIVNLDSEQSNGDKFLLIDEIENGLHHTVQKDFWEMLFKLAVEYNIQIFATTHSHEMIEAFAEIAEKPQFVGKGVFFEMFRHFKTEEVVANRIDVENLDYKLSHNSPFRGE